jgi:hypothetical protein
MQNNSNQAVKATSSMSNAELLARIAELEAKVEAKASRKLTFQISENKGGLLIRTGGKFPLSMYLGTFDKLIAQLDELKAFVAKYRAHFAVKDQVWDAKVSLVGVPEDAISRIKEQKPTTPAAA